MDIDKRISKDALRLAFAALSPYIPELTLPNMVKALESFGRADIADELASTRLLTNAEACRILNISRPTLYNYFKTGRLRQVRLSDGKVGVDPESLKRLMSGQE